MKIDCPIFWSQRMPRVKIPGSASVLFQSSTELSASPTPSSTPMVGSHVPKFGTVIPSRIFVGGIAANVSILGQKKKNKLTVGMKHGSTCSNFLFTPIYQGEKCQKRDQTRGQRPNESQKAVII